MLTLVAMFAWSLNSSSGILIETIAQMRCLHAQQVQEYSHLHVNQPVAEAHHLAHGGVRLPVLLVLSKQTSSIPNRGK